MADWKIELAGKEYNNINIIDKATELAELLKNLETDWNNYAMQDNYSYISVK